MAKSGASKTSEADIRSACAIMLGVADEYYTDEEARMLGDADEEAARSIANELRSVSGVERVDYCERLMCGVRSAETRHDTGTVYTPQTVVETMVGTASPNEFEYVVDIGCG